MRRLACLAPVVCGSYLVHSKSPPYSEHIRGVYENKIRQFAMPEKVFETFASSKEGKTCYMTSADLFKTFTPYNFSGNRDMEDFFTHYESQLVRLIDANGDGKISFAEYVFLVILLGGKHYTVSNAAMAELFEQYGGALKRKQFTELMNKARLKTAFGSELVQNWNLPDPRSTHMTEDDFTESTKGLASLLFKGKALITLADFLEVKELLSEELLFYEFHCFEVDENECISADSFARSLVSYLHPGDVEKFVRRIDTLDLQGKVTFSEFIAFQRVMDDLNYLEERLLREVALKGMSLSKRDILTLFRDCEAHSEFCRLHDLHVSEAQVDVFVNVLDLNGNGFLEPEEFLTALYSKATFGAQQTNKPHADDLMELLQRLANILLESAGFSPYFQVESQMTKVLKRITHAHSS